MRKILFLFLALCHPVWASDVTVYGVPSGTSVFLQTPGDVSPVSVLVGSSPVVFRDFDSYCEGLATVRLAFPTGDVVVSSSSQDQVVVSGLSSAVVYAVPVGSQARSFGLGYAFSVVPGLLFMSLRWFIHLTTPPSSE